MKCTNAYGSGNSSFRFLELDIFGSVYYARDGKQFTDIYATTAYDLLSFSEQ